MWRGQMLLVSTVSKIEIRKPTGIIDRSHHKFDRFFALKAQAEHLLNVNYASSSY